MQSAATKRRPSRKRTIVTALVVTSIVLSTCALSINFSPDEKAPDFYLGVDVAYGNFSDLEAVVSEVKSYTNVVVLGLPEVSVNRTLLDQSCDYIVNCGLNFIVLFTNTSYYSGWGSYTPAQWVVGAKERYGEKFLAVYRWDEAGGDQLDRSRYQEVKAAVSYSDAAEKFVSVLSPEVEYYHNAGVEVLTADYGLYWFDYQAGYDSVLAEFGWNNSRQQQVALARGAAQAHGKEWGAMITWTYTVPPYIESGLQLYSDLLLAYNTGAKYAIVLDYPTVENAKYGLLGKEHLEALREFWNYSQSHSPISASAETAYVLPEGYGFGFRSASDTVWGLWSADAIAQRIYSDVETLIRQKDTGFDVVCNNSALIADARGHYTELIFWNGTKISL